MYSDIIERWKQANPLACHSLGFHEYDGQLPNYTDEFINQRISELKSDISTLKLNADISDKFKKFEHSLLLSALEQDLFELDERRDFEENPVLYVFPLAMIEISYTARNFASVDDRIRSIIRLEKAIPSFLSRAQELLKPSLAKPKIEMALGFLAGIISYYNDRLIAFITQSDDESLIDEWSVVNIKAVESMQQYALALKDKYLPNSHTDFALGSEKFLKLLEYTEDVQTSVEKLLEVGEADLQRNYQAMLDIGNNLEDKDLASFLSEIKKDVPKPDELVKEAELALQTTRQFLVDSKIVSIPTDQQTSVIHTPEFARGFAFGAMNTPGPFEVPEAAEAYYWITPPDLTWPQEKIDQFMSFFNRPMLEALTIHEVWPGHYLQLLYNNQSTSLIAKMFARSITMIEGWAHYSEEMIYNAGYEPFDRQKLHVGQLVAALTRNVRYIAAVKMHCQNMTIEEAKQLFMEKAFMPEPNAQIEANRGTIDPMYLNYTLGKIMIMRLLEDYKREKGDSFSLRNFHDELLSYGSPPITVLRKMMLENPGSSTDIL
ncbi:MAG: DUF885 domain-containing protein [Candidatus Kariarchaeaceae archaeon]|jgi:uncharacterized protein (DUF885 family)